MSTAPFLSNTSFFRKKIFCFYCLEKKGWSDEFIKQKNYHEHFELVHQDVPQIRKLRDNQIRSDTTRNKTENNSDTKLKKGTSRNVFFVCCVALEKFRSFNERDCKRNFMWPIMQRGQCPIHNGTLKTFDCSLSREIFLNKHIETHLNSSRLLAVFSLNQTANLWLV